MNDVDNKTRCKSLTRAGEQCKNSAKVGSEFCYLHQKNSAVSGNGQSDFELSLEETDGQALSEQELRRQLMIEIDELIVRVKALDSDYSAPPYSPEEMIEVIEERGDELPPGMRLKILEKLRGSINEDLLDAETWKGLWYMVNYTLEYQGDMVKRRLKGDYEIDEWGLDWEFIEAVRPFLDFMYKYYWRVETTGINNIPDYDRTILVSNQSGQFPWDGAMIMTALLNEHPAQRLVRNLYADWFPTVPFFSTLFTKMGQTLDSVENGTRLLQQEELVCVFPEGHQGAGKVFKDRYKLGRFESSNFIEMARQTKSPIIPVSVVGAEETYVSILKSKTLGRLFGLPYFPVSMRFPLMGLFGLIPLPSKWYIDFGEPILIDDLDPYAAEDLIKKSLFIDKIRDDIQDMLDKRLAERRSVFY